MVVRVYVSGISGNKEVKKRQQRVTMILDSKSVKYDLIDITEPGKEPEKEFMQENAKARDSKYPLPPQIFNDEHYCGDYENFDMANELDELENFLNLSGEVKEVKKVENGVLNGSTVEVKEDESVKEKLLVQEGAAEGVEASTDNEAVCRPEDDTEHEIESVSNENGDVKTDAYEDDVNKESTPVEE